MTVRRRSLVIPLLLPPWATAALGATQPELNPRRFGARGDGVADDTAALSACFEEALATDRPLVLSGRYRIRGPILGYRDARSAGSLRLRCQGRVLIAVDPQAQPFSDVLYLHTDAACSLHIDGGSLVIDGAHRAGRGITVRHNASQGGAVRIATPLVLRNWVEHDERTERENHALAVIGDFAAVDITGTQVESVRRRKPVGGASKGISVSGFSGTVHIRGASVKDVRVPVLGSADADGIAVFGRRGAQPLHTRAGTAVVEGCVFQDCQGRSLKSQCSDTTVIDPVVRRQHAVAITHAVEFDFQSGNGVVLRPTLEYRRQGLRSPLGASHSCIAFQQQLEDAPMQARCEGAVVRTEVPIPRFVALITRAASRASITRIDGLRVIALDGLEGSAVLRAVVETRADVLAAMHAEVSLILGDIEGPLACPLVGYTGLPDADAKLPLRVQAQGSRNTLAAARPSPVLGPLSGPRLRCASVLREQENTGFAPTVSDCPSRSPAGAASPHPDGLRASASRFATWPTRS